jgi:arsenical pump membrane protein
MRLLLAIFAVGALITAFLSNDATALILTPVVYAVVTRLRLPPMPYLFATTFVADTASVLLPVSNPINVLVGGHLHLPLGVYLGHLLPAAVAVVIINTAVFALIFRRQVAHSFHIDWREALAKATDDRRHLRLATLGLVAVGIAYLAGSSLGVPLGVVAIGGAALMAVITLGCRRFQPGRVREHVSLSLFLYVGGLLILVQGLQDAGVTAAVVHWLLGLAGGPLTAVAAGVLGAGVAANLVNNLPATLFLLSGSRGAGLAAALRAPFLVGVLAGADLGPNLTPVGSLSTMLWLVIVRRKGLQVSALDYLKLGVVVTPLLLVAAWLGIGATFR